MCEVKGLSTSVWVCYCKSCLCFNTLTQHMDGIPPPSPEDSRALPCWARRFCSLSQSGNGMWWKKSEGEKKEKLVLLSHQLMAVKIIWTESCSFCWKSFCPRVFYSTTRYLLGAVQFDLGERKCLLCSAFVVFSVPQSSWSYFAEAFFLPCCGFH